MKYFIIIIILLLLAYITVTVISMIGAKKFHISFAKLQKAKSPKGGAADFTKDKTVYRKDIRTEDLSENGKSHFVFFSDLHAEYCFMPPERFCAIIDDISSRIKIDAVIFGGDIANKKETDHIGIDYLQKIAAHLQEKGIAFIGTTGNHDTILSEEQVASCGFIDLRKENFETDSYIITAVNDSGRHNRIWDHTRITEDPGKRHILVSHNPDWILTAIERNELKHIDHMLSGHIHGGQFRLPFNLENLAIRKDILPKRRVIDGVFDGAGITFFISRGLGCVLVPFRFFADPEITILELD